MTSERAYHVKDQTTRRAALKRSSSALSSPISMSAKGHGRQGGDKKGKARSRLTTKSGALCPRNPASAHYRLLEHKIGLRGLSRRTVGDV
jgi:hypothetical protein